jgi:protein phosphatase
LAPQWCPSRLPTTAGARPTKSWLSKFRLEFDDGSAIAVRGMGLIGRHPVPAGGENIKHLITLANDRLSVSRTHLEFGIGEAGLWIRDCFSTNGSDMEMYGRRSRMEPGRRVPAPVGCTIHLGSTSRVTVQMRPERAAIGSATINWGSATRTGARHDHNEDACGTCPPAFVVADGIGGHGAGDFASRAAVEALLPLSGDTRVTAEMLSARLSDARVLIDRIAADNRRPPGTTLSGVVVTEADEVPSWLIVNIGDSRTYLLNSDGFRQLTVDHTVMQELIDAGAMPASAASSHPARNLLTRALLAGKEYPADLWLLPMRVGDRVLVCSDGLTKEVDDRSIAAVLRAVSDPESAADELLNAAISAGARDDATALVVDVVAIRAGLS